MNKVYTDSRHIGDVSQTKRFGYALTSPDRDPCYYAQSNSIEALFHWVKNSGIKETVKDDKAYLRKLGITCYSEYLELVEEYKKDD